MRSPVGGSTSPAGKPDDSGGTGTWRRPFRSRWIAALLAAGLAVLVFANSLSNGFAYDDVPLLVENEAVHSLSNLPETLLQPYWSNLDGPTARELGLWRPVTTAFLTTQWALWGDAPAPYHGVNLLLHGAVTALVVLLLAELMPVMAAFLGGAIFAVHPVHVEAVANVVGGAELLAALFVLGASLLWVRGSDPPAPGRIVTVCALYALGFLTKESAAILPGVLVLLDAWRDRLTLEDLPGYLRQRGAAFASLAMTAGAVLWLRLSVLGSIAAPRPPLGAELLQEIPRIWTVAALWPHYARLLFFPAELSPDYAPAVIDVHVGWNAVNLTGVSLAVAFLALAWVAWRSSSTGRRDALTGARPVTLAVLWFVVTVFPVANLVFLTGVLLAERTLYLPSVGLAIGGGWFLREVVRRAPRPAGVGVAIVVALMAARTWTATPVWRSTDTVFDHLLRHHPESAKLQWALARRLHNEDRPRESMRAYRLAAGLGGTNYDFVTEVVRRLVSRGKHAQAETVARSAWRDRPDRPQAPALLAIALLEQGKDSAAVASGRSALELDPDDATTHHVVAVALERLERWEEAVVHRKGAIAAGEGDRWQQWRWLARLHAEAGDTGSALAALDSARARADAREPLALLDSIRDAWNRSDGRGSAVPGEDATRSGGS